MGAALRGLRRYIEAALLAQRGNLLCWVPVCLGLGIGIYFSLKVEPGLLTYVMLGVGVVMCAAIARLASEAVSPLIWAVALCLAGVCIAGARSHYVAEPVLGWRYYGTIEGRVIGMDRSGSDAVRLTLDRVHLDRVPPAETPARVRVSLHAMDAQGIAPMPGLHVMTTGHLSPPSGPVEPGGFDFQRHAWFAKLGAVGYTRVPLVGAQSAELGHAGLAVFRLRMAASARIQHHLKGDIGGFAAAVTTGDRSAISQAALNNLRASNLAHLLAISGLHMGLLTAVVLGGLRIVLVLHPYTAVHWPTKGIAAIGALIAAVGYLLLSGGNVATQRAFIMVAVALGALLFGRRAISLRAVAVAATLVLILRPEAMTGPGFQMSFAATTALVAVFGVLRGFEHDSLPRWARPVFGVLISSAVAGFATAPFAAAHFNTVAHYGLIANVLSVPLMGALVIPAAVVAVVMSLVGLEGLGLWVMGLGLQWILAVATFVAGIDGSRGYVVAPGMWVLPLISFGFLWVVLIQGVIRWAGLIAVCAGFILWVGADRPDVLIADQGALVGWMAPEGRVLSKAKGAGFVARNWLESDGDGAGQRAAAARQGTSPVQHLSGKRALAAFGPCMSDQIIVSSVKAPEILHKSCAVFDVGTLKTTGAVALDRTPTGWHMTTAREVAGDRLWTAWPKTAIAPDIPARVPPKPNQ